MISNHSTNIEGLHRKRTVWIFKSHVIVLLSWNRNLNCRGSILRHPKSKVARDFNVADNVTEFRKTNSEHCTSVVENCRDDRLSIFWSMIRGMPEFPVFKDESISLEHLSKRNSFAASNRSAASNRIPSFLTT